MTTTNIYDKIKTVNKIMRKRKTKMKRTLLFIVLCILSISLLASCNLFNTSQDDGSEYIDRFEYIRLPDGTYSIKAGDTIDLEKIIIPAEYKDIAVTQIASEAFFGAENLTDVAIPDSITHIGQSAFKECMQLKAVKIAENCTTQAQSRIGSMFQSNELTITSNPPPSTLITFLKNNIFPSSNQDGSATARLFV